jgi:hypothetical protein
MGDRQYASPTMSTDVSGGVSPLSKHAPHRRGYRLKPKTAHFGEPFFKLRCIHAPTDAETDETNSAELRFGRGRGTFQDFASLNIWSNATASKSMLQQSEVDAFESDKRFARSTAPASQNTVGAIQWNYDRTEIIADGVIHALGITLGLAAASTLIILTSGYSTSIHPASGTPF